MFIHRVDSVLAGMSMKIKLKKIIFLLVFILFRLIYSLFARKFLIYFWVVQEENNFYMFTPVLS